MKSQTWIYCLVLCSVAWAHDANALNVLVNDVADLPDINPGDGICSAGPGHTCTLRAAVQETNKHAGPNTVFIENGIYNLTLVGPDEDAADKGDLDVLTPTGFIGEGPFTVIDGLNSDRIFDIHKTAIMSHLGDMTLRNGRAIKSEGGGVRTTVPMDFFYVIVKDSHADTNGGGIAGVRGTNAQLELLTVRLENNHAGALPCGSGDGGGVYQGKSATGTLYINEGIITNNSACRNGGGIATNVPTTLDTARVRGNQASGAGEGGGIYAIDVEISKSTIDRNSAWSGGALSFRGTARLLNSTISGNTSDHGGGITSYGFLDLTHVTLAWNQSLSPTRPSAGIVHFGDATGQPLPEIKNTLITDNTLGNCIFLDSSSNLVAAAATSINNVDSDNTCGFATIGPGASYVNVSGGILPLAGNGGPTLTHLPLAASPAIDHADLTLCPHYDQRGYVRPKGAGCDIGSVEVDIRKGGQ